MCSVCLSKDCDAVLIVYPDATGEKFGFKYDTLDFISSFDAFALIHYNIISYLDHGNIHINIAIMITVTWRKITTTKKMHFG